MATVGRGAEQYTVRFPDGLRDRIKAAADANGRSMNAEIVATLEDKYPAHNPFKALLDSAADALAYLERLPYATQDEIRYAHEAVETARRLYHINRL